MVRCVGQSPKPLASLGWTEPLVTFRPFLSYNELGTLLEEGPSKLYDALSSVLGLEELVAVQSMLASARRNRQKIVEDARETAASLKDTIESVAATHADQRLATGASALEWPKWDVAALQQLVAGDACADAGSELALLRQIQSLAVPDADAISGVVSRLRAADRACGEFAGTNAERWRERATLLQQALQFHAKHRGTDCPVCGTSKALTTRWRAAAEREVATLRKEASACEAAEAHQKATIREAHKYLSSPPAILAQTVPLGLPALSEARRQWSAWATGRDLDSAAALADHLETHVLEFSGAVNALTTDAESEVRRREDVWRPVALAIGEWLPTGRRGDPLDSQR